MEEMFFVIDESGAKGYSKNTESFPGEFGVASGYMVPGNILEDVRNELDNIIKPFAVDGKLHITDLSADVQEKMRTEIFNFFTSHSVPWVYEAVYVDGLNKSVSRSNETLDKFRRENTSNVKVSSRPDVELLHVQIFSGAFYKALAFLMDRGIDKCKITVITDRVDIATIKKFKQEIDYFLSIGKERSYVVKGFDTNKKQPVKETLIIQTTIDEPWGIDFSGVQYEIKIEDSSLTVAADVLVNSVNHYINRRQSEEVGADLNTGDPLYDHPLCSLVYGMSKDGAPWLTDSIYAHSDRNKGT